MGQSICEAHSVVVIRSFAQQRRYISWSCRTRLILETSQICFHLVHVYLYLDLVGESYIQLGKLRDGFGSAKYHDSEIWV